MPTSRCCRASRLRTESAVAEWAGPSCSARVRTAWRKARKPIPAVAVATAESLREQTAATDGERRRRAGEWQACSSSSRACGKEERYD